MLFILGMHRSGTSCLTGSLERSGLHLGPVDRHGGFQPHGTLERQDVMLLNERILRRAGWSWSDPPPAALHPTESEEAEIQSIVAQLESEEFGALKDPRLLFTLPGWRAAADEPAFVGTFRHPLAVARSLHERDGLSVDAGLDLWWRYNVQLAELHRELGFLLVEFDLVDRNAYARTVAGVASDLGLEPSERRIRDGLEPAWERTDVGADDPLPQAEAELYEYLRRNVYRPPTDGRWDTDDPGPAGLRPPARSEAWSRWLWSVGRRLPPRPRRVVRLMESGTARVLRLAERRDARRPD